MEAKILERLSAITFKDIVVIVIIFLSFIILYNYVKGALGEFCKKTGLEFGYQRQRREDHDLLINTVAALASLQKKQEEDTKQSIKHDNLIREDLSSFMLEVKDTVKSTQNDIKQFSENRINDRKQSFEIQKQLTGAIDSLAKSGNERTKQMDALIIATRESIGDRINQKYKYYLSIKGIPEDEVDEFESLHAAYKAVGGNHSGDAKYKYCTENLPMIPVETKLKYED